MKSIDFENQKQNGYVSPVSDDVVVDCEISAVCESGGITTPGGGEGGGGDDLDPGRPRSRAVGIDENAFEDTVF